MSYQVLARKWRPRDFGSLVGQEHVVRALRHALEQKRLHHAYLFAGTRGVGKTTLARILAKCLNCETGVTPQPCGKCTACVEIDAGRFIDLLEVDAATNTRVDEMRQLLETAQYVPGRGRYKVYVIDEVHMLSTSAFNAMLKTLEEPPEHLKFILATTDPQKIPVTVLSRCLQFNLKQMPPAAIAAHLSRVLENENVEFDREALALISRAAAGSMRDALSLLDQAIAHGGGRVAAASVSEMLGAIDQTHLLRLLLAVAADDARAAIAVADEMQARSLSFDAALADLARLLLRIAMAARLDAESVQLYYEIALQGREDLPLAPDEHAGFVMTLLRMLAFRPEGASRDRIILEKTKASTPSADKGWPELVRQLPVTGAARELARNAELRRREGSIFELVVPKEKAYLADRNYQEKLKAALEQHLGSGVTVKVSVNYQDKLKAALEQHLGSGVTVKVAVGEASGASAAAIENGEREARRAEAARAVRSDGFVQDLVDLFDGKVVDSTIGSNERGPRK